MRDEIVAKILPQVRPYSMVPDAGLAATINLTLDAIDANIPGDLVECGTWRGGSSFAMLLAQRYAYGEIRRKVWMYDSFKGMGDPGAKDGNHGRGWQKIVADRPDDPVHFNGCAASVDEVAEAAEEFELTQHIETIPGWFAKTLRKRRPLLIAVLRVDCDWYDPCKLVFNELIPLVSPGGTIIIDDYFAWEGCVLATHEYLHENDLAWRIRSIADLHGAYMYREPEGW